MIDLPLINSARGTATTEDGEVSAGQFSGGEIAVLPRTRDANVSSRRRTVDVPVIAPYLVSVRQN